MLSALVPFLGSKWGKLGIEFALLVVVALGVRAYYIAEGKRAGRDEAAQTQQQDLEKARVQDRKDMQAVIDKSNTAVSDAIKQQQSAVDTLHQLAGVLVDLGKQRTAGEGKVSSLPDSDLHGYIVSTLNLRAAGDKSPGYVPTEERSIAACVTQYPLCQKQVDSQAVQLQTENQNTAAANKIADGRLVALQAKDAYIAELEKKFADLYNLHPPKYRSARCLFLWKCGVRKVQVSP